MEFLFAPMEGVTGYIYRRVHARFFPGVSRYYAPFFSPSGDHHFPLRGLRDLLPEENPGVRLVPQLLTNKAEDFIWAAASLMDRGYGEVDLNLGCPSGTVTAKRKGAGFLLLPEELDAFLERVFAAPELRGLAISLKTRIGFEKEEEFPALLRIYRQYPLSRLIVHPRLRSDYYLGPVHPGAFAQALEGSPFPVTWNGDVFCPADLEALQARFPGLETVMLGRGRAAADGFPLRQGGPPGVPRRPLRGIPGRTLRGHRPLPPDEGDLVLPDPAFPGRGEAFQAADQGQTLGGIPPGGGGRLRGAAPAGGRGYARPQQIHAK